MIKPGCILVGIYFVVTGLANFSSLPAHLSRYDVELNEVVLVNNWPIVAIALAAGLLVFNVIPGILLVFFAPAIAGRFDGADSIGEVSDSGMYVVLMLALATFFLVTGVSSAAVGLIQVVSEIVEYSEYRSFRLSLISLTAGAVRILSAIALYYHSLASARQASRTPTA